MAEIEIAKTKCVLADDMRKYVQIILKEYATEIPNERQEFLQETDEYYSRIIVEDSGTISMFATNDGIIMPEGAYKIFKYMKFIPGYGINPKHKSYKEGEIVNKNTYYDYIKHVFISGMSVEEFFKDALLHETMHFCGSDGGSAIREGLTELKTREIAQKYGLKASMCGYPKEVDIASRLQKIIGEHVINKITFSRNNREAYTILQENCGNDIADLFFEVSQLMDEESKNKYEHSRFGGVFGPIKKAKAYSKIDYSKVYEKLKLFEERRKSNNTKKQFTEELKIQKENESIQTSHIDNETKKQNREIEENEIR